MTHVFTDRVTPRGISVGRNFLGQRTYTSVSVMKGEQPLAELPGVLISDSQGEGIRLRFYYHQPSEKLSLNTAIMAEKFIDALVPVRGRMWPAEPSFSFTYNIHLIGWDERIDGEITRVFRNNTLELNFYARALPIAKNDFLFAGTLAHETFHLMKRFYPEKGKMNAKSGLNKAQKTMFEEAGATLFGHCMDLQVSGEIPLGHNPVSTITNSNNRAETRKGSFNDHMLGRFIEPGFEIDKDYASTIFGPMLFTTLWAEYGGQVEMINVGDPAAEKFMNLCENNIWPPEKLIPVLQKMADDSVDPPELRRKQALANKKSP